MVLKNGHIMDTKIFQNLGLVDPALPGDGDVG